MVMIVTSQYGQMPCFSNPSNKKPNFDFTSICFARRCSRAMNSNVERFGWTRRMAEFGSNKGQVHAVMLRVSGEYLLVCVCVRVSVWCGCCCCACECARARVKSRQPVLNSTNCMYQCVPRFHLPANKRRFQVNVDSYLLPTGTSQSCFTHGFQDASLYMMIAYR